MTGTLGEAIRWLALVLWCMVALMCLSECFVSFLMIAVFAVLLFDYVEHYC